MSKFVEEMGKTMSASIIVTTPKKEMANAKKEAEACIQNGGGYYFRRFGKCPRFGIGSRIFYVEDGYVRGFAEICKMVDLSQANQSAENGSEAAKETLQFVCEVTGKNWGSGFYAFMDAKSWKWIKPIPMKGFQGYRYFDDEAANVEIIGGWKDPKPEVK